MNIFLPDFFYCLSLIGLITGHDPQRLKIVCNESEILEFYSSSINPKETKQQKTGKILFAIIMRIVFYEKISYGFISIFSSNISLKIVTAFCLKIFVIFDLHQIDEQHVLQSILICV